MARAPRTATDALASTIGMAAQGVARFAYLAAIARFMPPEAFATASSMLSLAVLLSLAWPTPLANAASRWLGAEGTQPGVAAALTRSALGGSLALAAASVPLALALGTDVPGALGTGAVVFAYGCYAYARGARLGLGGARLVCVTDVGSALLALALLAGVLSAAAESLLLIPIAIGYLAFALVCAPRAFSAPAPLGSIRRFAAWNVLGGFATNGLLLVAMVVAEAMTPVLAAAAYAAAYSLATPASMLGQAVSQVLIASVAAAGTDAAEGRRVRRAVVAFCALATAVFALAAALAPIYMPWFYPTLAGAVGELQLLLIAVWLFTLGLVPAALLLAAGRARAAALGSVAGSVIGFATMLGLTTVLGTAGVTAGLAIGSLITLVALTVMRLGGASEQPTGH